MVHVSDGDELVDALLIASRALVGVAARSMAEIDITLPQYRALVVVASRPTTTVGELAAVLDIHPTTATRLCDRLVAKALLRRAQAAEDRRTVELDLTPAGRRLLAQVLERRRTDVAAIVDQMGSPGAAAAARALTAFADAAGEAALAVDPWAWPEPTS